MAVAFDAAATAFGNASATSASCTISVGSGTNRALIATVVYGGTGTGIPAGAAVVYDPTGANQTMTLITSTTASAVGAGTTTALYGLVNPTSGASKSVKVSVNVSTELHICAVSFTGVDQTGGSTSFPHGTITNNATATSGSITVTSATGNAVVAVFSQNSANMVGTNQTLIQLENVGPNATGLAARGSGAASVNVTATWGGTNINYCASGCDILAATAAGPTVWVSDGYDLKRSIPLFKAFVSDFDRFFFQPPAPAQYFTEFPNVDWTVQNKTIVGEFNNFVNPSNVPAQINAVVPLIDFTKPPKAFVGEQFPFVGQPGRFPSGWQTYDSQINARPFLADLDRVSTVPTAPTTPSGWQSYDNLVRAKTFVADLDRTSIQPAVVGPPPTSPTGWQSYDNLVQPKTFVSAFDQLARSPPATVVVSAFLTQPSFDGVQAQRAFVAEQYQLGSRAFSVPTGWQSYDVQVNARAFVPAELGAVFPQPFRQATPGLFYPPDQLVLSRGAFTADLPFVLPNIAPPAQGPTGWHHDQEYSFAKPYPVAVHVELSPFIPALPSVPAAPEIPSGDGPPWHLTQKEIKRLLHYREELARLQEAWDKQHRERVDDILNDVREAAFGKPEPEVVQEIEQRIRELPVPRSKSVFALGFADLTKTIERNELERQQDLDDDAEVHLLLTALFANETIILKS